MNKLIITIIFALFLSASYQKHSKVLENLISNGKYQPTEIDLINLFESYNYEYSPQNYQRFDLFKERLNKIISHNKDSEQTYQLGINKFTFMLPEELKPYTSPQNCSATENIYRPKQNYNLTDIPTSLDWRDKGVVSQVKNQLQCGSCWTFSTTGAVEAHWAIKKGTPPPLLSEQQLIDCAGAFNNFGCNGGLPSQAFEYIFYNGGIETESDYPYLAVTGNCTFNAQKVHSKVGGSYNITFQDENELLYKLATEGPISIAYEVTDDFMNYKNGVYSNPSCSKSPADVNHAVLAVGYGATSTGQQYYIVKNSWGPDWGINGYFLIERGVNMCGLADCASYPLIPDNYEVEKQY